MSLDFAAFFKNFFFLITREGRSRPRCALEIQFFRTHAFFRVQSAIIDSHTEQACRRSPIAEDQKKKKKLLNVHCHRCRLKLTCHLDFYEYKIMQRDTGKTDSNAAQPALTFAQSARQK